MWTCDSNSLLLQPTHHPEILEFQRLLRHQISIDVGGEVQVVLTSHHQLLRPLRREAVRNAMAVRRQQIASRACRSANCVSKAVVNFLVQHKLQENLVTEIVRQHRKPPSFSISVPFWQLRLPKFCVDPSGNVVMTPVEEAQQNVNLGHRPMHCL